MNIWYIHPYAGSPKQGMSFRPYYLTKHLNELGHNAVVVSALNHHLSSFPHNEEGLCEIEGVPYYLVNTNKYKGNGVKRVLNMLGFGFNLLRKPYQKFAKQHKPDVIISSSTHPFHTMSAKYYAKKYGAKLVFEVRDIWPLSLQELVGLPKFHPICVLVDIFQKYGYRNSDHCVSLLDNSEQFFIKEGLPSNSFTCIPNGVEITDDSVVADESLITELKNKLHQYDTVIGYTGAIGIPNNMFPLIKAAKLLAGDNIGILLVGDGGERPQLQEYCKNNEINNVIFQGKVPKDQVKHIISLCDAMFINAKNKPIYQYGISPNKVFDYMLENKFVFNGIEAPGNPIEKSGAEIRFNSDDEVDLAEKVLAFHNNENINKINSKDYVLENHLYSNLAKKYSHLLSSLV